MSEKNNPPPPSEDAVKALSESILSQISELRSSEELQSVEDEPSIDAENSEDDSSEGVRISDLFEDAAEFERYRKTLLPFLLDDVTGLINNLDSGVYEGFMRMLTDNYAEHEVVQDDSDNIEWWSVDYGLWVALADEDEVTIEFQWSDDDAYYLWGRIGNGLPIEFDAILIALWRADKFEDDAETSFIYWPIAELKLVYSVLQKNILNHPPLMDSLYLERLQSHLQQEAKVEGIDPTNHAEWAAWLNG